MLKLWLSPSFMVVVPAGEMLPFEPVVAVMVW